MSWEIPLFVEQGKTIEEMLDLMPQHKDESCKIAWDWWDDKCPRDMMDAIQGFAALGWSTHMIFKWVEPFFTEHGLRVSKVTDKGWEFMALAIEHAVRQQRLVPE